MLKRILMFVALCGVALVMRVTRLEAFAEHQREQRYEDVYYLPPADWMPTVSIGYTSAFADLLWCRLLVYFGEELGQRGQVKHLFQYTDAILSLDPSLRAAYRWAATGVIYRPAATTLDEAFKGADYLERAVERWPEDGELRWDLASYLRFELAPMIKDDPARKEAVLARSIPHLHEAVLKGSGPPWLALNNATLLSKLGKKERAIQQLEEIYPTVNDAQARQQILARIAQLRAENHAEALQVAVEQFERDRQANFPYLDSNLFLLVGPKVAPTYPAAVADHFEPAEMTQPNE